MMSHVFLRLLVFAANVVALPAQNLTTPITTHGAEGELVLGGAATLSLGRTRNVTQDAEDEFSGERERTALSMQVSPSAAVFVVPNFALGLQGDFGLLRLGKLNYWSLAIGPEFIVHIPLGQTTSLLPKLAFVYRRVHWSNLVDLVVDIDFALHTKSGLSLVWGPHMVQELYGSSSHARRDAVYGVKLGILGWI